MSQDKIICNKSDLTSVADTIRSKLGVTDTYYVSELSSVINDELTKKLPTLTNPGTSSDLLSGKELIDQNGNVVIGTASGGGGGSSTSKFSQLIERTIAEITAEDLQGVTKIGYQAFAGCYSLTSVTIPNSVTYIGSDAFNGCEGLTSVTIENGVTRIEVGAFYYCAALSEIIIPDSVTFIGSSAFYNCCNLTSIIIGRGVTRIGNNAFYINSRKKDLIITMLSETPPTIEAATFLGLDLKKIIVPSGTSEVYKSATNWASFGSYIYEEGSTTTTYRVNLSELNPFESGFAKADDTATESFYDLRNLLNGWENSNGESTSFLNVENYFTIYNPTGGGFNITSTVNCTITSQTNTLLVVSVTGDNASISGTISD